MNGQSDKTRRHMCVGIVSHKLRYCSKFCYIDETMDRFKTMITLSSNEKIVSYSDKCEICSSKKEEGRKESEGGRSGLS
jgi:hypothetical protein